MPDLHRLESANANPLQGGVLITWPDHRGIEIAWQSDGRLILPTLQAAKRYTAEVIEELRRTDRQDLIDATNWASLVAAMQAHIDAFNTGIRNTWAHTIQ